MLFAFDFITGMKVGVDWMSDEDDKELKGLLTVDLFIVRFYFAFER